MRQLNWSVLAFTSESVANALCMQENGVTCVFTYSAVGGTNEVRRTLPSYCMSNVYVHAGMVHQPQKVEKRCVHLFS